MSTGFTYFTIVKHTIAIFYGHKLWSLTLSEEHRLRVLRIRYLEDICTYERDRVYKTD